MSVRIERKMTKNTSKMERREQNRGIVTGVKRTEKMNMLRTREESVTETAIGSVAVRGTRHATGTPSLTKMRKYTASRLGPGPLNIMGTVVSTTGHIGTGIGRGIGRGKDDGAHG